MKEFRLILSILKRLIFGKCHSYFKEPIVSEAIAFIDGYILDGYGSYNDKILQTFKDVLINDGIPMDTSYTSKAFWGLKEYIKKKKNHIPDKRILFIHTGGTLLFFDKLEDLNNER
jgi:D-cysteine desulfhydrase